MMRSQGEGRIVQNSSILGLVTMPYRGAYVASKFALEGLTDTLRLELAGTGIGVSLIEPGPILSSFRDNAVKKWREYIDTELIEIVPEAAPAEAVPANPTSPAAPASSDLQPGT